MADVLRDQVSTPEQLVAIVAHHNGGALPRGFLQWAALAGRLGLGVRVVDAGPLFSGALRAGVVLVPDQADESRACSVVAHEIAEHLLLEIERHDPTCRTEGSISARHALARRTEGLLCSAIEGANGWGLRV